MKIAKIRSLCRQSALRISLHAMNRLDERNISIDEVEQTILFGEVIEQYPNSEPHPSCLMFYMYLHNRPVHVVVGLDTDEIVLVTAYIPSTEDWEKDYKTRRRK